MKKTLFIIFTVLLIISCGKKREQIIINGFEQYQDPFTRLSFVHPKEWVLEQDGINISYYSSREVVSRFVDYGSEGKDGARLMITTQKMDSLIKLEDYVQGLQNDLKDRGFQITDVKPQILSALPGMMIQYNGNLSKDSKIVAVQVSAVRDSFLYTLKYEAFNDLFEQTRAAFDSACMSLILPKPKKVNVNVDPSIPSNEFITFSNQYLKISYPDNFEVNTPQPKAPIESSIEIKGYRQDSYIRIDVIPAQKLSPEKIFEQNAKFYKSKSKGETSIEGVKTVYLNYSIMKNIQSRVYFLVKNDRFYRIIMNYYEPMRKSYLPAFEKSINSLKVQ
jgi:hypothetical protein